MKKRLVPLWLVLTMVLLSSVATVVAMTITNMPTQIMSLFTGKYRESDFMVIVNKTDIEGENKIIITLNITNTNINTRTCIVTLQLLYSNGDIINIDGSKMSKDKTITDLVGGAIEQPKFIFSGTGLVIAYNRPLIIVEQTS